MQMRSPKLLIAAIALIGGLSATAQAQIGSGWSPTSINFYVQTTDGATQSGDPATGALFTLPSGAGRSEARYDTQTSGTWQFQGYCTVNSLDGDRICLKQTFDEANGPWNMIAVSKANGSLYEVEGGAYLADYTVGNQVQINTLGDADAGTVDVYINGTYVETKTGGSNTLYDKCGAYATSSGSGPATVSWTGVQFWVGGTGP